MAEDDTIPKKQKMLNFPDKKMHGYLIGYGGGGLASIVTALYMWGSDIKDKLEKMYERQEKMLEVQIQYNQKFDKLIYLQEETNKKLDDLVKATYRNRH